MEVNKASYPLSNPQLRMWYSMMLDSVSVKIQSNAYVVPFFIRLIGPIILRDLEKAICHVANRHEMLRARFDLVDGEVRQWFEPLEDSIFKIEVMTAGGSAEEAHARAIEEGCRPIDLAREAPFRAVLYQIGEDDHLLLLVLHHLVTDGVSMNILFEDLGRSYAGLADDHGRIATSAPRYVDPPATQAATIAASRSYWRAALEGAKPGIEWPKTGLKQRSNEIRFVEMMLPAELVSQLRAVARKAGVSLYVVLLTAYRLLLELYTEQSDMLIGVPCAGRPPDRKSEVIGLFVNTLPVRVKVDRAETVRALIERVGESLGLARAHDELPVDAILRAAGLIGANQPSAAPIGTIFNYRSFSAPTLESCGLKVDIRRHPLPPPDTELTGLVEKIGNQLLCRFDYRTDRFGDSDADRLMRNYRSMLERLAKSLDQSIGQFVQPSPGDLDMQDGWGKGPSRPLEHRSVIEMLAASFAKHADRVAIVQDRRLTYSALAIAVNEAARSLRANGVGPGNHVALYCKRSIDVVVAILAILETGAAFVPLSQEWPNARIQRVIDDLEPELVLVDSEQSNFAARQLCLSQLSVSAATDPVEVVPPVPHRIAYILFTSGSTGHPKGVAIRHDSLCNQIAWFTRTFKLGPRNAVLARTPFSFDASIWEIFAPLAAGATLVLATEQEAREPSRLRGLLQQHRITDLQCVPSLLDVFLDAGTFRDIAQPLRIFCGGEALSPALVKRTFEATDAPVVNLYGPTEATVQVSWSEPESGTEEVAVGRPIDNAVLAILSPQGNRLPTGVAGELWIAGLPVADGYVGTADQGGFCANPIHFPSQRCYRTGDYARWRDDGQLVLLGRIDSQIKIRGQRFEIGEIEAAFLSLPEVRQVAFHLEDDGRGKILSAFVTCRQGEATDSFAIRKALHTVLPSAAVPTTITVLDAMPLSANGKLDLRHLAKLKLQTAERPVAPVYDIEKLAAKLRRQISTSK